MARFLIVGEGRRSSALAELMREAGHVAAVVALPERSSLEHVAIVCWLSERSPERFLLGAIDSSMRGFVYGASEWEPSVLETAARNSIPVAAIRADPADTSAWRQEALAAVDALLKAESDQ
jgi:hypothetical protein